MDKETELYKAICDRQETLIKDLLKVIEDYQRRTLEMVNENEKTN